MPYYEFECLKCWQRFTVHKSFEEYDRQEKERCPKCGSKQVEQVVSSVMTKTAKKS